MKTPQKLGAQGETIVTRFFNRLGICAENVPDGLDYDVCIENTVKVEVKTARRGKDGKYNFTLWKANHANHVHTDYVTFLCVLPNGKLVSYFVPTYELITVNKFSFVNPENYNGRLAKYKVS